jgi:CRP-like cAMP-binding protein
MHSTEALGDMRLFKGLPEKLVSYLENHSTFRRLEEGEFLFKAGEVPRAFVVVVSGQLKFSRTNKAGKEQVFSYAQTGDVCGLPALTDPYRALEHGRHRPRLKRSDRDRIARDARKTEH